MRWAVWQCAIALALAWLACLGGLGCAEMKAIKYGNLTEDHETPETFLGQVYLSSASPQELLRPLPALGASIVDVTPNDDLFHLPLKSGVCGIAVSGVQTHHPVTHIHWPVLEWTWTRRIVTLNAVLLLLKQRKDQNALISSACLVSCIKEQLLKCVD